MNDDYIADCERAVRKWNEKLAAMGCPERISLPHRRFHRRHGIYAGWCCDPAGALVDEATFARKKDEWLLSSADDAVLREVMVPVHEPGKVAQWIRPPKKGIGGRPLDFAYVRG